MQTPTMVSIGGVFDPAWKLKFKEARWARQFFQTHPVFMVGVLLASLGNSISGGRAERVIFPGAPPWSIWLGCFFASLGNSISERRAERVSFSRRPPGLYGTIITTTTTTTTTAITLSATTTAV